MAGRDPSAGMLDVDRVEMATRDLDAIAKLMSQLYVEHRPRFRCADPGRVGGLFQSVSAGLMRVGVNRCRGFEYGADISPVGCLVACVTLDGDATVTTRTEQVAVPPGHGFLLPVSRPSQAEARDGVFAAVRMPLEVAAGLAEEWVGLPAADLRFESIAPVSDADGQMWAETARFLCRELVTSGITEINPLMAQNLPRLAAAMLLKAFPNTTMTTPYLAGPGWAPSSAVRRAAAFIDAHASQPITLADIAAAAGVTGRALQYAFRRHYDTTPTGYLRRVRLERARRDLRDAEPGDGVTVAAVARMWGWASPGQFSAAYRRRYGQPPGQTLRT
jgi:AraC-like DNA-binding protein